MFTMLESYWVVDSIASRLRVTVSPRIISRNLDVVGDIKTLHLNLDLSPKQGYEYVSILWIFLLSKIQIQIERVRSIFNPANFPATTFLLEQGSIWKQSTIFQIVFSFNNLGLFPWHIASRDLQQSRGSCKWFPNHFAKCEMLRLYIEYFPLLLP